MMKEFENKVALVTGGNSGIGQATALAFARKGAYVVIASRRVEEGEQTVQLIKDAGSEAIFVKTDVTKAADVENLISKTVKAYGRLDYAFNNAGVEGIIGPSIEQTEDNWNNIIDTNLKGIWLSMKYEIPPMLKQGGGAIVNNASVGGVIGIMYGSIYCASKHGVIGLTKAVALEQAQTGIRINAVCSGAIETPMAKRAYNTEEFHAHMLAKHPIGRFGQPEEVANAVVWLCSDGASFITGHPLLIDGGFAAQ